MADESNTDVQRWKFQNTVSYWACVLFIQGSVLFTVGSICIYPSVAEYQSGFVQEAMSEYGFMIGSWLFFIGCYLIYLQVINQGTFAPKGRNGENQGICGGLVHCRIGHVRFLAPINFSDSGHVGAVCNCIGAALFVVNTMAFFGLKRDTFATFNLWYVMTIDRLYYHTLTTYSL
jgi:hypothetical protein